MRSPKAFRNEPLTDFSKARNRNAQIAALADARKHLGREYPILIGGKAIKTGEKIRSVNPADRNQVIGVFQKGTKELALKALDNGWKTFETWKTVPAKRRADLAFKAAKIMRRRRFEVNA